MPAFSDIEPFVNALPLPVAVYAAESDTLAVVNGPFRLILDELAGKTKAKTEGDTGAQAQRSSSGVGEGRTSNPAQFEALICDEARRTLTDWRDHAVDPVTLDWGDGVKLRPFFRPLFGRPGQAGVLVLLEPVTPVGQDQRALTALGALEGVAITVDDRFGRLLARFGEAAPANDVGPPGDDTNRPAWQRWAEEAEAEEAFARDQAAATPGEAAVQSVGIPRSMTLLEQTAPSGARVRIIAEPGRLSEEQMRLGEELRELKALVRRLEAANSALVRRNSELMDQLTEAMESM